MHKFDFPLFTLSDRDQVAIKKLSAAFGVRFDKYNSRNTAGNNVLGAVMASKRCHIEGGISDRSTKSRCVADRIHLGMNHTSILRNFTDL